MKRHFDSGRKRVFFALYLLVLAALLLTGVHVVRLHQERQLGEDQYTLLQERMPEHGVASVPQEEAFLQMEQNALLHLQADYPDAVAWVRIPGTPVDYPVMHSGDNSKYLNHLPDGTKSSIGSIFADARCSLSDQHLILYGHNLSSGGMFGSLKQYKDPAYYEEHPEIVFITAEGSYTCPIFSVRQVNAYDSGAYRTDFENAADIAAFLEACAEDALYPCAAPTEGGRVLTLSTCTDGARSSRLIIQALLVKSP